MFYMDYENIWELSKDRKSSLNRQHGWSNNLHIAFLVAFILQLLNMPREVISNLLKGEIHGLTSFIIEFIIIGIIFIFLFIFTRQNSELGMAIEIKEKKLKKQEALDYIAEMQNAF